MTCRIRARPDPSHCKFVVVAWVWSCSTTATVTTSTVTWAVSQNDKEDKGGFDKEKNTTRQKKQNQDGNEEQMKGIRPEQR